MPFFENARPVTGDNFDTRLFNRKSPAVNEKMKD
jgi:hypothetical protein